MEIIVTSIVEMRTRVNSAAKVSYQQVYSSDLYTSINRRIQTEWPPVSACFSLSQPQNTLKKIQRMVIKLGFLMLRTIVTTFCFWQGPNLRPSACQVTRLSLHQRNLQVITFVAFTACLKCLVSNNLTNKQNLEGAVGKGSGCFCHSFVSHSCC